MQAVNMGQRVTEHIFGLVEDTRPKRKSCGELITAPAWRKHDVNYRNTKRRLRVGLQFVEIPARDVCARFVDSIWIDGAGPKQCRGFVLAVRVKGIVLTSIHPSARQERFRQRHGEHTE